MHVYSVAGKEWRVVECRGVKPSARFGHTMTLSNGYVGECCSVVYLFGGAGGAEGRSYFNELYKFNTLSKKWQLIDIKGKPPKARYKHEAIMTRKGNLFILGGTNNDERFLDAFEFNPETKAWAVVKLPESELYRGRYGFSGTLYGSKQLIIFGVGLANG